MNNMGKTRYLPHAHAHARRKKQLTDEMAKCWLVCHNCHSLKGYENSDHLPIEVIERKRNELTLFDMDLL